MKKNIILLVLLFMFYVINAQTKLKFDVIDSCTGKKPESYNIFIQSLDFDKELKSYYIDSDSILKIEKGIYIISIDIADGENAKSYNLTREFKDDSLYNVNIELPKIMRKLTSQIHYPTNLGFYYCDVKCNGWVKDFYSNGKLRISGKFKNGIPLKILNKYNINGELVEIQFYDKNGTYKKSKYPDYSKYLKNN